MAAPSVSFNGTRVNASDSSTDWANFGSTGPAPAAEAQLAYQNSLAVNKRINSTSLGGLDYDPGTGALDMTAAANRLWFVKVIVADSFDLNATYGVNIVFGSANNAYYEYNVAGSGSNNPAYSSYPAQGGYLITAIDPNIAAWRENAVGSPNLTAVDYFGAQCAFITGSAKAENLALDAIDIGTGLTVVDGVGAAADFIDFLSFDQDTTTNRYGVVTGAGDSITSNGMLTIGSATATEFSDSTSIVTFPDGYHSEGLLGVTCDLQNASTTINISSLLIGQGAAQTPAANDTRPDLIVTGTSGAFTSSGSYRNFNNVVLTSACTLTNADVEFADLTQSSASISDSTLRTNSLTGVAAIDDATFGASTGIRNCEFIQSGAGHAVEITSPGTYTLTGLTYSGYGADTSNAAAIYNNSGGAVTLNISGGGTPTVRDGTGASTTIVNAVPITLNNLVAGSRVYIENTTDSVVLFNVLEATTQFSDSVDYTTDKALRIRVRNSSSAPFYKSFETTGTLTSSGFVLSVNQELDQ